MSETVAAAHGLVKRYGEIVAVDHIDLKVQAGDVYGFLGPNGAGKTTTLRMMLGLIRPSAGRVELFGRDPLADGARALDGVAGFVEAPRFYPYLSGRTNLDLLADYDGGGAKARVGEVLELVELTGRARDKVGGYSHGMRQRLGIAAALLRAPRLLLLDEPTTGLDPGGMRDMREMVRRLSGEGMTIMLSSHLLAEVEELCNRVAIVRSGRIAYEGDLNELKRSAGGSYRLRTSDQDRAERIAAAAAGLRDLRRNDGYLLFTADEASVGRLSLALAEHDVATLALIPETVSLESLFFRLTEGRDEDGVAADTRTEVPA